VRLAVALLKDRQGKIVLDVPVEGNLDDPKFRIRKVVVRVLVNILEKVATSPFSLLGAVFGGGGEELGYQEFAPGSADLTPADQTKLTQLTQGLYARPALGLELAGSIDAAADRAGLQRAALDQEIRTRQWTTLRQAGQTTNSAEQLVIAPDTRARWIEQLYAEKFAAKDTHPPPAVAAPVGAVNPNSVPHALRSSLITHHSSPVGSVPTNRVAHERKVWCSAEFVKGAVLMVQGRPSAPAPVAAAVVPLVATNRPVPGASVGVPAALSPDVMETLLLATYPVTEADLTTLAAARARAVQDYLLQSGRVTAARLFLKNESAGGVRQQGSRVYLQFR
jgi:hypothetical protein